MREEDLDKLKLISSNIRQGTLKGFDHSGGVAIGTRMAENLGLSVGDTLRVISPDGDVTPFGVNPRVKAYPIVAIFEIGMSEYDSSIVMMPLSEAQLFFNQEGKVQSLEILSIIPIRSMRCGHPLRRPQRASFRLSIGVSAIRPSFPRWRWSAT